MRYLFIFFLSSVATNGASLQVINVQNGIGDTVFSDASGTLLTGAIAAGGFFNQDSGSFTFTTAVANNDFAALKDNFNILGSGVVGANSNSLGGAFAGFVESPSFDLGTISPTDPRIGSNLYIFVGDQSTLAASTSFALVDVNRQIESDLPFPVTYTLNPMNGSPLIGTIGSVMGNVSGQGNGTNPTIQLVPEPSSLFLNILGVLTLLRRRR